MTNPYNIYATDTNLESKGVTVDYPGFSILIARAGGANKNYTKTMEEISKPYRRLIEQGLLQEDVANKLLIEAYAVSVILGWENVVDKDGNEMEFSKENCIKLLTDLPVLFSDIQNQANDYKNYKAIQEETDIKN